ncbi:hypothetical protein BKA61DRAFT_137251 [Leptodontidium sp. MPI-SDFR-AT-0119]|nr:hypothetical protein BKA61DRAFT_137251 [Leptodontidium sp. MPI-SDFR-AT-0119]
MKKHLTIKLQYTKKSSKEVSRLVLVGPRAKKKFCRPFVDSIEEAAKTNISILEVLNHTRFERITFRSGIERAAVAPAVLQLRI